MNTPNELKKVLLEEASTDEQRQFAKMLAEECQRAKAESPWLFVPTVTEYERMVKYSVEDTCPKCKKGRVVLEVFHGNFGQNLWLKCKWGEPSCDFAQCINDEDGI